jgi:hypothetical protein
MQASVQKLTDSVAITVQAIPFVLRSDDLDMIESSLYSGGKLKVRDRCSASFQPLREF